MEEPGDLEPGAGAPEGEQPVTAEPPPVVEAEEPKFDLVEIFYATSRKRTGRTGAVNFYGGRRGSLEYGTAVVSVPRDREIGELPTPSIWTLEFRPDPDKHFILTKVTPVTDRRTFLGAVAARVAGSERKEVFVFIHGFNTTFEDGSLRTAQLAADLRLDGAPIMWSWPSAGGVLSYWRDADQAENPAEASALAAFLRDVVQTTGATRVHLVAHSMGNRPLMAALKLLDEPGPRRAPMFDEIVFAAPDVGVREFDELWPSISRVSDRFTLYASARDKALMLSQAINAMQRIGDASPIVVRPGLQTIDTTDASDGLLGHADFAGTALDDFRAVIWLSLAPDRRCVLTGETGEARWWRFGGACPALEFREASQTVRLAGSLEAALAEVGERLELSDGEEREYLEKLRARLEALERALPTR